jgi:hypothetical protein
MRACAADGCHNPVPTGRGRPAIYCSPTCRPSWRPARRRQITVELANPDTSPDGRPADRVWIVRLRRADKAVTIADNLGWPSASALAGQLEAVLYPTRKEGAANK